MKLTARDCSPFDPQPTVVEAAWLRRLVTDVRATKLVVSIAGRSGEDEPIVYCDRDGTWWAGRYIGSLSFDGSTLTIAPRFGLATLRSWLLEVTSIVMVKAPGQLREDENVIAQLLASVWVHGFVEAARHGLPALRRDVITKAPIIRGRLDVAASLHALVSGHVVSIRSERLLDHAASDAIVAAYVVLRRWLGVPDEQWMPPRARELIPQLMSVTGARPRVPTKTELDRIRYTPITAGFAPVAELSLRIANHQGLASDIDARGQSTGVLLDVAELWELYVLSVLRRAATPWSVSHGTREKVAARKLLCSDVTGQGMGTLIPDAIFHAGDSIQGVADAKYKSLRPTRNAPNGPQREDLYQMAAYLDRFTPTNGQTSWGALIYPQDFESTSPPPAEQLSPWSLNDGRKVIFITLPHDASEAATKLRELFTSMRLVLPITA